MGVMIALAVTLFSFYCMHSCSAVWGVVATKSQLACSDGSAI